MEDYRKSLAREDSALMRVLSIYKRKLQQLGFFPIVDETGPTYVAQNYDEPFYIEDYYDEYFFDRMQQEKRTKKYRNGYVSRKLTTEQPKIEPIDTIMTKKHKKEKRKKKKKKNKKEKINLESENDLNLKSDQKVIPEIGRLPIPILTTTQLPYASKESVLESVVEVLKKPSLPIEAPLTTMPTTSSNNTVILVQQPNISYVNIVIVNNHTKDTKTEVELEAEVEIDQGKRPETDDSDDNEEVKPSPSKVDIVVEQVKPQPTDAIKESLLNIVESVKPTNNIGGAIVIPEPIKTETQIIVPTIEPTDKISTIPEIIKETLTKIPTADKIIEKASESNEKANEILNYETLINPRKPIVIENSIWTVIPLPIAVVKKSTTIPYLDVDYGLNDFRTNDNETILPESTTTIVNKEISITIAPTEQTPISILDIIKIPVINNFFNRNSSNSIEVVANITDESTTQNFDYTTETAVANDKPKTLNYILNNLVGGELVNTATTARPVDIQWTSIQETINEYEVNNINSDLRTGTTNVHSVSTKSPQRDEFQTSSADLVDTDDSGSLKSNAQVKLVTMIYDLIPETTNSLNREELYEPITSSAIDELAESITSKSRDKDSENLLELTTTDQVNIIEELRKFNPIINAESPLQEYAIKSILTTELPEEIFTDVNVLPAKQGKEFTEIDSDHTKSPILTTIESGFQKTEPIDLNESTVNQIIVPPLHIQFTEDEEEISLYDDIEPIAFTDDTILGRLNTGVPTEFSIADESFRNDPKLEIIDTDLTTIDKPIDEPFKNKDPDGDDTISERTNNQLTTIEIPTDFPFIDDSFKNNDINDTISERVDNEFTTVETSADLLYRRSNDNFTTKVNDGKFDDSINEQIISLYDPSESTENPILSQYSTEEKSENLPAALPLYVSLKSNFDSTDRFEFTTENYIISDEQAIVYEIDPKSLSKSDEMEFIIDVDQLHQLNSDGTKETAKKGIQRRSDIVVENDIMEDDYDYSLSEF